MRGDLIEPYCDQWAGWRVNDHSLSLTAKNETMRHLFAQRWWIIFELPWWLWDLSKCSSKTEINRLPNIRGNYGCQDTAEKVSYAEQSWRASWPFFLMFFHLWTKYSCGLDSWSRDMRSNPVIVQENLNSVRFSGWLMQFCLYLIFYSRYSRSYLRDSLKEGLIERDEWDQRREEKKKQL